MARYREAVCRLCRREGVKLFLKGERCYTDKCALERRPYSPGQHGQARMKKTEYGLLLREKQKLRRIYGILEKQFRLYFEKAEKQKGVTGEKLLILLERRLDNVVYKMGFAHSRNQARQLVRHGHILINNKKSQYSFLFGRGRRCDKVERKKPRDTFCKRGFGRYSQPRDSFLAGGR